MSTRPVDELQRLSRESANGELICAAAQVEIHVFLQTGRVAWATDSRHPFAFASHLQAIARIDPDTLRQVVEECRRERLPLGETLVEWGLATWDGVRTALAHQISLAVSQLAALDVAQTLFLERGFRDYNEKLTFAVGDFIGAAPTSAPESALAPAASPSAVPTNRAQQLRASIEGLSWVEVLENDRLVDGDPACPSSRVPLDLVRMTILDDCDFVAIRSARSSIVGMSMARPCSIWCRLSAESNFGAVVSAICAVAGATEKSVDRPLTRPDSATWSLGAFDDSSNEALRSFQKRAQEMLGAIVISADTEQAVAGSGCSVIEPERCIDLARRRARALRGDTLRLTDPDEAALDSIGFSFKTMVSGESRLWCFGAELGRGESLWLFLDRRTSQGLGWAYLSAVSRALVRASGRDE